VGGNAGSVYTSCVLFLFFVDGNKGSLKNGAEARLCAVPVRRSVISEV